ncbi:hypothetical protein L5515_001338 [Caenorhabditis briggsae]|uniref:Uncharacterized protein n=1 Tax=Caenorhabditis briggsae TaxID=6238 RepID=A0AAE9E295_CAEBR|nr:hypothetical protein L5515_001338 [Caenorhabditis briggsae]
MTCSTNLPPPRLISKVLWIQRSKDNQSQLQHPQQQPPPLFSSCLSFWISKDVSASTSLVWEDVTTQGSPLWSFFCPASSYFWITTGRVPRLAISPSRLRIDEESYVRTTACSVAPGPIQAKHLAGLPFLQN